jgi:hypothetical protein
MGNSILQDYLTLQFIPMDDQAGVDKLIKSANAIEKKLRKDKSLIAPYTLVALDPNTPPDDQILIDVQNIITQNWSVYVNKAGGNNLVTYNRAVILEVLSKLSADVELAGIIWLTGSSAIKYFTLDREQTVLREWLLKIGNTFEAKARELWAVNDLKLQTSFPAVKPTVSELKSYALNKETLKRGLSSAAGANYIDDGGGTATGDTNNRYWPNNNANWAGDFGRIATEAISTGISAVITANNKEVTTFLKQTQENLTAYVTQLEPYFEKLSGSFLNKSNSLDKRSQLLWVKESQYSAALNESYRDIDEIVLPFAIAKDISDIIQPIYPASVDFFAKEIARVSRPEITEIENIYDHLIAIKDNLTIGSLLSVIPDRPGRKSLLTFLSGMINKTQNITAFTTQTGIPQDAKASKAELITWLIHDMQSIKLANIK